jgi:hypothetical protein
VEAVPTARAADSVSSAEMENEPPEIISDDLPDVSQYVHALIFPPFSLLIVTWLCR